MFQVAVSAETLAELADRGMIGATVDQVSPEIEALIESVLRGYLSVTRDGDPET